MMNPMDFSIGTINPETFPTEQLAEAAAQAVRDHAVELNTYPGQLGHEVSFAHGWDFHIHAGGGPFIRLAFGWAKVDDIREGIARLARCIEQARD